MASSPPSISVLMPVRNAERTIQTSIESIRSQSFKDWELVIVNDGSTDQTGSILNEIAANEARIRILHRPPCGIASALNEGLGHCHAEWIARMDADDWMLPERLAMQWRHAKENPNLGVVSGLVENGGTFGGFKIYVDWLNAMTSSLQISINRFIESPVAHPSVMFRKELVHRYGGYRDGNFPEDYELWLRWLEHGVEFGKVNQPVILWSDLPSRLTRTDPRYAIDRFYTVKLDYLASWVRKNICPSREIWLWGAGRVTRKRFAPLASLGIQVSGFIDIDPNKCSPRRDHLRVILPDALPSKNEIFVITCVAKHGARDLIQQQLESRGHQIGVDFIHAA